MTIYGDLSVKLNLNSNSDSELEPICTETDVVQYVTQPLSEKVYKLTRDLQDGPKKLLL